MPLAISSGGEQIVRIDEDLGFEDDGLPPAGGLDVIALFKI